MLKRVLVGLLGVISLVVGAALLGGAWWVWTAFGANGGAVRDLGTISVSQGATAVVVDVAHVGVDVPYLPVKGRTELIASDPRGAMSMVAGSTGDIDALLAGSHYDAAFLVDGAWEVRDVPGAAPLADVTATPGAVTGEPAVFAVTSQAPGSVLLIPAAAGPGTIDLSMRFNVRDATPISVAAGAIAVFLIITGLLLIWVAIFAMRPRGRHE